MKQYAISVDHAAHTVTVNGRIADVPREEIDAACAQANVRWRASGGAMSRYVRDDIFYDGDPAAEPVESNLGFILTTVGKVAAMPAEDRRRFLDALRERVCFHCGEDAPCYCDPSYDD